MLPFLIVITNITCQKRFFIFHIELLEGDITM
ncbi:hypothetical protein IG5_01979 [Bacillus toyonensis]|nr:hypothetical protein IG5_01979 [Bacillus toyonensis]